MPIINYQCRHCGHEFEKIEKAAAQIGYEYRRVCPECKSDAKSVLSTPSAPQWRCSTAHSRSKGF